MNQRDISEIRRRLNPKNTNAGVIRGCYVTADGRVISRFATPVSMLSQDEVEKYMTLFRKVLSGSAGQNLIPVDFTTEQVQSGEEHALLSRLCDSRLEDEEAVASLFDRAVEWARNEAAATLQSVEEIQNAPNRLVLLMHDGYDVPYRDANGEIDRERSEAVLSYILCCVCPVKQNKPFLTYNEAEGDFHSRLADWAVNAPDLGFMFPAYEEGGANISRVMYYTRTSADLHDDFLTGMFGTSGLQPAPEQHEAFNSMLQASLGDECSMQVVQNLHDTIGTLIEEQKADKTAEPLSLGKAEVKRVLEDSGVTPERIEAFDEAFDATFGIHGELPAVNMVTPKRFEVSTPSVQIKVDPAHNELVETRVIDGKTYIMILVDGDVEVNGMRLTR